MVALSKAYLSTCQIWQPKTSRTSKVHPTTLLGRLCGIFGPRQRHSRQRRASRCGCIIPVSSVGQMMQLRFMQDLCIFVHRLCKGR